jgi:hypothetical protein
MNSNAISLRTYLLALGTVGVLVAGAIGFSALFAHANTGPAITATVTNASNAVVTSAPIGSTVVVGASVASSTASSTPTGSVNFSLFNNLSCSGTPTVQSNVALVGGMASSSATPMTASGLSFLINYNGDASNTPSVSQCAVVTPTSAAVTVTNALSATSVVAGSSVTGQATLGGNTANAGGTVAYNVFTNNSCTLATTSPASVTVTNGVVPASAALAFNQAGTYFWHAVYSGDANNSAATSSCGALTVNAVAPTTGTVSGNVFSDLNFNKVKDGAEAGLSGWTVALLGGSASGPSIATTTTDANGNYSFPNLTLGTYFVAEVVQQGWKQETANAQVVLSAASTAVGVNFANIASSTKKGDNGDNDKDDNNGNSDHSFHLPNFNANFHAFLKGLNGKHKGEDKNKHASTTLKVKGDVKGDNDNDGD